MNLATTVSTGTTILSDDIQALLSSPEIMQNWVHTFGSPIHIMFPQQAVRNAIEWQNTLHSCYPNTKIQFALKACKSHSLLRAMAAQGVGADAASSQEMLAAMDNLVPGHMISVTGPSKPDHEILMAASHNMMLHIDCREELLRASKLFRTLGVAGRIFLRVTPQREPDSRFGFGLEDLQDIAPLLVELDIKAVGLSFHINDYELDSRRQMLKFCLRAAQGLLGAGISVFAVDVGGGYPLRYMSSYDPETYRTGDHISNKPRAGSYPYAAAISGPDYAASVLADVVEDVEFHSFLIDHDIEIYLQPGRALLDQCGVTIFKVIDTKSSRGGPSIAVLDGMSFSVSENWFGSDFVPEPIIVTREQRPQKSESFFLVGRSCLESDAIRTRAITSQFGLCRGDLLLFPNTAGYQMDSNESAFHQIPVPRKIAAVKTVSGWSVTMDETFTEEEIWS